MGRQSTVSQADHFAVMGCTSGGPEIDTFLHPQGPDPRLQAERARKDYPTSPERQRLSASVALRAGWSTSQPGGPCGREGAGAGGRTGTAGGAPTTGPVEQGHGRDKGGGA